MKQKLLVFSFVLISATLFQCGNDDGMTDGKVTTDIITNPGAEGELDEKLPVFEFEEEEYDFGQIIQGEKVKHSFKFTNTGDGYLVISSAKGSCGCTVPEWPKEPIAPGGVGAIEVEFNSAGKSGQQDKTVTVVANTVPNKNKIKIKADVIVQNDSEDE